MLARHPHVVELRGQPAELAWPALCPYCGQGAGDEIAVPKVSRRLRLGGRDAGLLTVTTARIPFCSRCAERHRSLVRRPTLSQKLVRTFLTPMLIPVVGAAFVLSIVFPIALSAPLSAPGAVVPWGLSALMVLTMAWSLVAAWRASLHDRVEKQTEITLACDFSGDVSSLLEGHRRLYSIRNRAFAEAFAEANRKRLWTQDDDARSAKRRNAVFLAGVVIAVGVWLWVVLGP